MLNVIILVFSYFVPLQYFRAGKAVTFGQKCMHASGIGRIMSCNYTRDEACLITSRRVSCKYCFSAGHCLSLFRLIMRFVRTQRSQNDIHHPLLAFVSQTLCAGSVVELIRRRTGNTTVQLDRTSNSHA